MNYWPAETTNLSECHEPLFDMIADVAVTGRKTPQAHYGARGWGLHPGAEITPDTPELFKAARQSLLFRGDGGTGWSKAWKINFWARLLDGDHAYRLVRSLVSPTRDLKITPTAQGGLY